MKILIRFAIAIFILFTPLLQAKEKTLTISTGFNYLEANVLESIIAEAFKRAELKLNFQILPNQRSLLNANSGVNDGEAARIYKINKIYKNLIRVNVTFHNIDIVILSKKDIKIHKISDLKKCHIAVVRGVKITEKLAQKLSEHPIIKTTNYEDLLKMLTLDRIDVVIVNKIGAYTSLRKFKNETFYLRRTALASPKLYMFLNKKNKDLVPKLEKAFKSMQKDGTIKRKNRAFEKKINERLLKFVKVVEYD